MRAVGDGVSVSGCLSVSVSVPTRVWRRNGDLCGGLESSVSAEPRFHCDRLYREICKAERETEAFFETVRFSTVKNQNSAGVIRGKGGMCRS